MYIYLPESFVNITEEAKMTRGAKNKLNCQNTKIYAKRLDDFLLNEFLTGAQNAKKVNLTSGHLHQVSSKKSRCFQDVFLSLIVVFLIPLPLCYT